MKNILLALAASAAAIVGVAAPAAAQDKTKVCFVHVGSKTDGGWTQAHDIGRQQLQEHFGDKIETPYLENVPEGPDAERAIERMARSGCALVFTTSFGFMDATLKVAEKFPDVKFEHATGYKTAANMGLYNARFYEGRYILGQIAAKESKKGLAGYIVSFPIPEVVMGINAFMLGAQSINPDFKIKIVWVNSWFDPGKEADAAKALFDQGADLIVQHTDSTAAIQVAEERGLKGFGQSSDMIKFAPKAQMTAIVDDWGPHYIKSVKAVLDGTWKANDVWEGIKDGTVHMAEYTNMSDETKKLAEETEAKIVGGWNPFTGPIFDQDGKERYAAGVVAPDGDLLGMNWYVKGVDDKLPQ